MISLAKLLLIAVVFFSKETRRFGVDRIERRVSFNGGFYLCLYFLKFE